MSAHFESTRYDSFVDCTLNSSVYIASKVTVYSLTRTSPSRGVQHLKYLPKRLYESSRSIAQRRLLTRSIEKDSSSRHSTMCILPFKRDALRIQNGSLPLAFYTLTKK